jgi:hypothetical protein
LPHLGFWHSRQLLSKITLVALFAIAVVPSPDLGLDLGVCFGLGLALVLGLGLSPVLYLGLGLSLGLGLGLGSTVGLRSTPFWVWWSVRLSVR